MAARNRSAGDVSYTSLSVSRPLAIVLFLEICLSGCASQVQWQESPIQARQTKTDRDLLSYGTATKIKKGVTRQDEVLHLFGAPNITTTNSAGNEVWLYDRISMETQQDGWSEARRFQYFLGIPLGAGVSGQQGSAKYGGGRVSRTSTITVIIDFDEDHVVSDYGVRATQY